jgi:perosamine synthetase
MDIDRLDSKIRSLYDTPKDNIPLHAPVFLGNESKYVQNTIKSTFVSSVGKYVSRIEQHSADRLKVNNAVAVVNGTAALHVALRVVGVLPGTEVITQALTFVATANAIAMNGAIPIFVDVDKDTMGLSPEALERFLDENAELNDKGNVINRTSKKQIAAVLPMHTFGFVCDVKRIRQVCTKWNLPLVEDAAEALGSYTEGIAAGSIGTVGTFSFNGNKIITSGGGGLVVTNDKLIGEKVKHLTTTAKLSHQYEFVHDEVAYNYRMPNLNAALLLAQFENLDRILNAKKQLYNLYRDFAPDLGLNILDIPHTTSQWNYWLISAKFTTRRERNEFLAVTNKKGIMTRPIWQLMYRLPMYSHCQRDSQENAEYLEDRIVNIPSSAPKALL